MRRALLLGVALGCSGRANPALDFANRDAGDASASMADSSQAADLGAATDVATGVDVVPAIDVATAVDAPAAVDAPRADVPPAVDVPPVVDVPTPSDRPDAGTTECSPGASRSCYDGPGTAGQGLCRNGTQVCTPAGAWPTACAGQVVAVDEVCGNGVDDDCDGLTDERCRVLNAFAGCPRTMYETVSLEEEFDSATTYAARWSGSHVAPSVSGGGLVFGPHPLSSNWWENYSPTATRTTYGDVMLCAHLTLRPASSGPNTGTLELSLRGPSEGMVVAVRTVDNDVLLQTKQGDGSWVLHGQAPLAFTLDAPQTVDVVLWASGDRYRAEVRNQSNGALAALGVRYSLPATGVSSLLGWMLRNPARVERFVIGTPSAAVRQIFENRDY